MSAKKKSREEMYEEDMKNLEKKYSKEMEDFKSMSAAKQREFLYHGQLVLVDMIQMHEKDIAIMQEWLKMVEPKKFRKAVDMHRKGWEKDKIDLPL